MFSVLFEVHPRPEQWETYLGYARMLKPELERVEGFVDNIRYRSLTREGWLLSLSEWRDENALIRWRNHAKHHVAQEKGRSGIFLDYHLRVGQVMRDTSPPDGQRRLTEAGQGTAVVLIDARKSAGWVANTKPGEIAQTLGLVPDTAGLVSWDVFDAVLSPGDVILLTAWRDHTRAEAFEAAIALPNGARLRRIRILRDYGMFDRREAPQYYPALERRA